MRGDDQQRGHVQLPVAGAARAGGPSAARDPPDDRRRVEPAVAALRDDVRDDGRPSIPPEQLLRALLLQVLYSVRSERLLMEQLEYNLLFRWFVGLAMDDAVWTPTTFTKNRDRLLRGDIAQAFFEEVLGAGGRRPPAVGRAFHRGRHAARGRPPAEEFPREGRAGAAARRSGQSDGQFPWGTPLEPDASVDHRSRQPAVPQGERATRPSCRMSAKC